MARWINVKKPFSYHWRDFSAMTDFVGPRDIGDHYVKDEIADYAVKHGYASEGKKKASSRSTKGSKSTRGKASKASTALDAGEPTRAQTGATGKAKAGNKAIDATASSLQPSDRLDRADLDGSAADDRRGSSSASG